MPKKDTLPIVDFLDKFIFESLEFSEEEIQKAKENISFAEAGYGTLWGLTELEAGYRASDRLGLLDDLLSFFVKLRKALKQNPKMGIHFVQRMGEINEKEALAQETEAQ